MFDSIYLLLAIAALFSFLVVRYLKLPLTIGLMILGMALSVLLMGIRYFDSGLFNRLPNILENLNFHDFLMKGVLGFLLFAGAVHINVQALEKERIPVFVFAILGTLISTVVVGFAGFFVFGWLGMNIPLLHCMLFGALISPTDPIAVLSIFENYKVSPGIKMRVEGESLFNDGIGIVIFIVILRLITGGGAGFSTVQTALLFLREAVGGILFGLLLGMGGLYFLKQLKNEPKTAVLVTLVITTGGYALANTFEVSGALAMVASGLTIGNWVHRHAGHEIRTLMKVFWEIVDEIFNSMLFVLMGLAIVLIDAKVINFYAALLAIIIALIARFVSVYISSVLVRPKGRAGKSMDNKTIVLMTWSGLRGALAFALALSLGNKLHGHFFIFLTYSVAAFAIIVQGLTIGKLVRTLYKKRSV
ncbi:MAG: sodium:proton antiporter [Bacteroidales bacterium]|nr:sodium:proton antiporter [Bacteroidales bacterium]MCF6342733.1 sodium:proton antiporter [Bacteroidales bacterium]